MQLRKSTKEATIRSKKAAEQAEKRRLEKRKNKLAKVEAQVHVNIIINNNDDDTQSNTEVATTVDSEAPNEPIHEINVSNPVMPNDNLSMMSSDSMEAWAFRTDHCEPGSKPRTNPTKKLNRFGKAVAVEIAEADDNANITVLPDNNATYDESISNSIAFACGYDARYETTYQSTQLESDSESDLESDSEEDFQSPHTIPNGSSDDEYFSTEE